LRTMFLLLIGFVFVTTLIFAVLIWKQTVKVEKRALEAKRRKEEYMQRMEKEREEEIKKELEIEMQKMAKQRLEEESGSLAADLPIDNGDLSEA